MIDDIHHQHRRKPVLQIRTIARIRHHLGHHGVIALERCYVTLMVPAVNSVTLLLMSAAVGALR
jgi:hypothetical protein